MPLNSTRLAHFLAVVDDGTVTGAAASAYVSQSALSQSLRELEREVGTPLFHRVGRGLRLTAAGEALVDPARQALRDLQTAADAVAAVADVVAGRLDLACLATLAADPVAGLIGAFRAAYPAVAVRLGDPDHSDDLVARVRSGDVELGVTEPPDELDGLVARALRPQDLVWLLPPGAHPRDLASMAFVTTPAGTSSRRHLDEACAREGLAARVAVETAQRDAIVPLVLAGAGAALVPQALATAARTYAGLVVRECRPRARRQVAVVHRDGPLSPAATRFLTLALT